MILSDEELESAEPEKSRLIEITDFVDLHQIDPIYFRTTYYLAPEGEAATKAYDLLRQVMDTRHKVAIGTVVMRNKEYLVAIRPDDDVLKLETMYFADEIRSPPKELPEMPDSVQLSERELSMAELLLESMENEWDPSKYHDTHREKVEALIDEKRQGHDDRHPCPGGAQGDAGGGPHGRPQCQHRFGPGSPGRIRLVTDAHQEDGQACPRRQEGCEGAGQEAGRPPQGLLSRPPPPPTASTADRLRSQPPPFRARPCRALGHTGWSRCR